MKKSVCYLIGLVVLCGSCKKETNDTDFENADGVNGGMLYNTFWDPATGYAQTDAAKIQKLAMFSDFFKCKQCHGWDQEGNQASYIGRGIFETNDKRLRLGISGIWLNTSYDPSFHSQVPLGPGAFQFTPIYFSAQYNTEKWSLTSEYAIRHIAYNNNFGNRFIFNGKDTFGESYYFQGEYRFTPRWEGFIRYDVLSKFKRASAASRAFMIWSLLQCVSSFQCHVEESITPSI